MMSEEQFNKISLLPIRKDRTEFICSYTSFMSLNILDIRT